LKVATPAPDQFINAPNDQQLTPDGKSEATVGLINVQNNTGTDWWDYLWVPVLVAAGAAVGYGVYRKVKKAQTQPPTEGYDRVNDPNGTSVF